MKITVNGQSKELPAGATVADLVAELGMHPQRVAVERNRKLVPRSTHAATALADGDELEIVTLVGGG